MYKVTRKHIDEGIKQSKLSCPIATCFREVHEGDITVHSNTLRSSHPLSEYAKKSEINVYSLSPGIKDWISKFDTGKKVNPISIEVDKTYIFMKGE